VTYPERIYFSGLQTLDR